jgi:hypothetical protein
MRQLLQRSPDRLEVVFSHRAGALQIAARPSSVSITPIRCDGSPGPVAPNALDGDCEPAILALGSEKPRKAGVRCCLPVGGSAEFVGLRLPVYLSEFGRCCACDTCPLGSVRRPHILPHCLQDKLAASLDGGFVWAAVTLNLQACSV